MSDFAYFKDNLGLIIGCLVVGCVFGLLLPYIAHKVKAAGDIVFSNKYHIGMVLVLQLGLEIFLFQQWIFTYNADVGDEGVWFKYSYLPLTVVIPAFFVNALLMVIAICNAYDDNTD